MHVCAFLLSLHEYKDRSALDYLLCNVFGTKPMSFLIWYACMCNI